MCVKRAAAAEDAVTRASVRSIPSHHSHGIGSFLRGLWTTVRPVFWSGSKSLGREALRTDGKIMTDIAEIPHRQGFVTPYRNVCRNRRKILLKSYAEAVAVRVRERGHLSANSVSRRTRKLESRNDNLLPPPADN